jgi:hypothetical protein
MRESPFRYSGFCFQKVLTPHDLCPGACDTHDQASPIRLDGYDRSMLFTACRHTSCTSLGEDMRSTISKNIIWGD